MKSKKAALFIALVAIIFVISLLNGKSAEETAKQFVENMLDGNAKTCVSMMSDEIIESSGYATKKQLISALDDALDDAQREYKGIYGKKWKFTASIADAHEYGDTVVVYIKVKHTSGELFNSDSGEETMVITVAKTGAKWLVYDW